MGRSIEEIRNDIENGGTSLGIEFGSTRIKAVLVDGTTTPVAQGSYEWENRLENGIWTYSLEDIWKGLRFCYQDLAADVKKAVRNRPCAYWFYGDQRHDAWIYGI